MKKFIYILLVLSAAAPAAFAQGIEFGHGSWADVKAQAKAQNKLIFVDFYTDWCAPCKFMTINIFPQKEAGDFTMQTSSRLKSMRKKVKVPQLPKNTGSAVTRHSLTSITKERWSTG